MVDQPRVSEDFRDLDAKENERRRAIGLPPLPKRASKQISEFTEEDIEEYMAEVRAAAQKLYSDQQKQLAYIERARKNAIEQIYNATKGKRIKPKPSDRVIIAGKDGTRTATVEEIVESVESTRKKARDTDDKLEKAFPTIAKTVETPGTQDKAQNVRIQTFGQKLASFEKDVFRRAFPILSKVIETLEGNRREERKEKSRTAIREGRVLNRTEQTAVALESLSREQEKSVDLLRELLKAVRATPADRPNVSRGGGRLAGLGRALRRALPAAAGVGLGLGAYALYSSMQNEEERPVAEQQQREVPAQQQTAVTQPQEEFVQRVNFDIEAPTLAKTSMVAETPQSGLKSNAGPLLKSSLRSAEQETETGGGVKVPVASTPVATPVTVTRPKLFGADSSPTDLGPAESNNREMVLRARKVTFKGDEILFRGLQSTTTKSGPTAAPGGGGYSSTSGAGASDGAKSDLDFAPGVDQRINNQIAQKIERIEGDSGKDFLITSGFRDAARNAGAGGATSSAHTRGNAVDIQFNGNEADTAAVIESAKKAGIGGIGVYRPGMLHLDTESNRAWGPDFTSKSIPEWAKGALDGEGLNQATAAASPVAPTATTGAAVMGASQENAMAERTPAAPTVIAADSSPAGQASPGAEIPGTFNSPNDPGPVEPEDAAERYAMLFNMAA